ncbi:MAG: Phosphate starvation-inducible protein PhoH, predicted ATPase, partial [uncultured Solirubrobacteraceae bacterium]
EAADRALQRGGGRAGRVAGCGPARDRGSRRVRGLPARQRRHARRRRRGGRRGGRRHLRGVRPRRPRPPDLRRDDPDDHRRARPRDLRVGGARGRRLASPLLEGRAQERQPEALRRLDPPQHRHVRHRPGRHRQDVAGRRVGRRRAVAPRGQPHHPHAAGGRGGRAARLPARRPDGEDRPVPAPAVRRAAGHARRREGHQAPRAGDDRGRPAGVHARPDAQRLLRDPRRGAEHLARADEDVPDPARLRLEDGHHRRRDAGRPPARPEVRAAGRLGDPPGRRGHRLRELRPRGRRAASARAADRRRVRVGRSARSHRASPCSRL